MAGFDLRSADGIRKGVGRAGVDSGTMVIADNERFPAMDFPRLPYVSAAFVAAPSGYGDGNYEVLRVIDTNGSTIGVEVLFTSRALETLARKAVVAELGERPSKEQIFALWDGVLDPRTARKVTEYLEAEEPIAARVWNEGLVRLHPAEDGVPELLGQIEVTGVVGVGDPCYVGSTIELSVPGGTYDAVTWMFDAEEWGPRVARLGIYRVGRDADGVTEGGSR